MEGSAHDAVQASELVDETRLWDRHVEMAKLGATPKGGVNRQALSAEDIAARELLLRWTGALGMAAAMDDIGNMFFRHEGIDPAAAAVAAGSHADSQPTGGRFDGIYGVLAALEAIEAIREAGITTRRPLELVVWNGEEGSRFEQGCMGSQVFARPDKLATMLALRDHAGISVAQALGEVRAALPPLPRREFDIVPHAFIEAHIEQGPVLEMMEKTVGIVTGMQGSRRFSVEVTGEEAHAGTTPRAARKDALFAALDMVAALRRLMHDEEDVLRFTVGRFEVSPGALAVVPARVVFTIDFRHPDEDTLSRLGDRIEALCRDHAGPCTVTVTETRRAPCRLFQGMVLDTLLAATQRLGLPHMLIYSGAGHDTRYVAERCPAGMIFIPCEKGISHREDENAAPADLAAGARVLADTILELAR